MGQAKRRATEIAKLKAQIPEVPEIAWHYTGRYGHDILRSSVILLEQTTETAMVELRRRAYGCSEVAFENACQAAGFFMHCAEGAMTLLELRELHSKLLFCLHIIEQQIQDAHDAGAGPDAEIEPVCESEAKARGDTQESAALVAKTPQAWAAIDWLEEHVATPTRKRWES